MGVHHWYRNVCWSESIAEAFWARWKRSRSTYNKAEYLRIQASYLIFDSNSDDDYVKQIGIALMQKVIVDYSDELHSSVFAMVQLGDYHMEKAEYEKAEDYYRQAAYHSKDPDRKYSGGRIELKLSQVIVAGEFSEKLTEAFDLLMSLDVNTITLICDRFQHAYLTALICEKLGKRELSFSFAEYALEISRVTKPQFRYHPTFGRVNASENEIAVLHKIIED